MTLADKYIAILAGLRDRRELIEASLARTGTGDTFDDITVGVMRNEYHFYPLPNAVVIAQVLQHRHSREYYIYLAGGDLKEILDFQDKLCEAAYNHGCTRLTMTGRKGWAKPLKNQGWRETAVYLELAVVPEAPDGQEQDDQADY